MLSSTGNIITQPIDIILQERIQRNSKNTPNQYFFLAEAALNASCSVVATSGFSFMPLTDKKIAGDLLLIWLFSISTNFWVLLLAMEVILCWLKGELDAKMVDYGGSSEFFQYLSHIMDGFVILNILWVNNIKFKYYRFWKWMKKQTKKIEQKEVKVEPE